jgi:phosphoribosylanthranilate isomerase
LLKICDVRDLYTAEECARRGANLVGIHCIDSIKENRRESLLQIASLVPARHPGTGIVVVTRICSIPDVVELTVTLGPSHVQLHHHGWTSESIGILRGELIARGMAHVELIGVITPSEGQERYSDVCGAVDLLIIDSTYWGEAKRPAPFHPSTYIQGVEWAKSAGKPVLVAGGITARNARDFIEIARPTGLDIQGGVRYADGKTIDMNLVERIASELRVHG